MAFSGTVSFADPGPKGNACDAFDLSPDQEIQMKALSLEFGDKRVDLESGIEHARLKYERVLANETSDAKAIRDAATGLAEHEAAMTTAEELFHAELYVKVLKPAQRALIYRCGPGAMGEGHPSMGPEHHRRPPPSGPHPKNRDEPRN